MATKPAKRTAAPARTLFGRPGRDLLEQVVGTSPLQVDESTGVIRRVKVLGRFSRNAHGVAEAENGTDYGPCMALSRPLYEGLKVKCNHPADRAEPGKERPVEDTFGVLRDVVQESDERGEPALWGDLHCLTTHPMYPRVVEDVRKGLGVYGLSHNAAAKRERFDPHSRRLVIEELAVVRSVDLVDRPATNRTLWESETVKTTLRQLIESRTVAATGRRAKWKRWLLEDDAVAPPMDAPMDAPADGDDPDAALWGGFKAAIMAILEGDGSADEKAKKIAKYIKAHDKLTSDAEPADEPAESEDDTPTETPESVELAALRAEKAARELCESLGFAPTTLQIEAVAGMRDAKKRRELAESFKGHTRTAPGGYKPPRSVAPGGTGKKADAARDLQESEEQQRASVAADLAALRG